MQLKAFGFNFFLHGGRRACKQGRPIAIGRSKFTIAYIYIYIVLLSRRAVCGHPFSWELQTLVCHLKEGFTA